MDERLQKALHAAETAPVASLDFSMLQDSDLMNIILQRSEILADQLKPNRIIAAWCEGNPSPAQDLISKMGSELAYRAAGFVRMEYLELRSTLRQLRPRRIADIGCGYGLFDLFVSRDFECHTTLIDTESGSIRHFGFAKQAASYSSLETARKLLASNGVTESKITLLNPKHKDLSSLFNIDLAVSFLACGFHFPWQSYSAFFQHGIRPGGSVILDLRRSEGVRQIRALRQIGTARVLGRAARGKAKRVHLVTAGHAGTQSILPPATMLLQRNSKVAIHPSD